MAASFSSAQLHLLSFAWIDQFVRRAISEHQRNSSMVEIDCRFPGHVDVGRLRPHTAAIECELKGEVHRSPGASARPSATVRTPNRASARTIVAPGIGEARVLHVTFDREPYGVDRLCGLIAQREDAAYARQSLRRLEIHAHIHVRDTGLCDTVEPAIRALVGRPSSACRRRRTATPQHVASRPAAPRRRHRQPPTTHPPRIVRARRRDPVAIRRPVGARIPGPFRVATPSTRHSAAVRRRSSTRP